MEQSDFIQIESSFLNKCRITRVDCIEKQTVPHKEQEEDITPAPYIGSA